tara:strand:- start:6352 stop:6627 length:276 start_codon:yes stop_codon:yes gene_type:complete
MKILTTQTKENLLLNLHDKLVSYSNRTDFYNFYPLEAEKLMKEFQIVTDGNYKKHDLVVIAKKLNKIIKCNDLSYQAYKLINSISYNRTNL